MKDIETLRQNMISATKELAKYYSLEDLNLVVTDTVLGWVLDDFTAMMDSYSREYIESDPKKIVHKSIVAHDLFYTRMDCSKFLELNTMRGNIYEEDALLKERVQSVLQEEGYIAKDSHPQMRKYITLPKVGKRN